ncbi:MAG: phage replisome organizer N-terminal domain-containing protein [Bacteroidales bacterium]|jgi:hypothetical protein|nr:phage replisome organizer N-terminal domain-containing protein [Bacteroidales bacterium]
MGSRTWIKVYCDKWIEGTLRSESPDLRGVWIDLLALAGGGDYGDTGEIQLRNGIGFTDAQIAQQLNISLRLWRKVKKRLLETERIKINQKGAISITNWTKYQSEYNRQKPYRNKDKSSLESEGENPIEVAQYTTASKWINKSNWGVV